MSCFMLYMLCCFLLLMFKQMSVLELFDKNFLENSAKV